MNQNLMKKARQLQREMLETQRQIEEAEFTANVGPVTVIMTGNKKVRRVVIDEDYTIEGPDDKELLEDSFVGACSQCGEEIDRFTEEKMSKYKAFLGGLGGF